MIDEWTRSRSALRLALAAAVVALTLSPRGALAHDPFETTTAVEVREDSLDVRMVMARETALELVGESHIPSPGEAWQDQTIAAEIYEVTSAGEKLELTSYAIREGTEGEEAGDFVFQLTYSPPQRGRLRILAGYLETLGGGYTAAIQVSFPPEILALKVLHEGDPVVSVDVPPATADSKDRAGTTPSTLEGVFLPFLGVGIHHVLVGYDHLLFLLGVLLGCRRLRHVFVLLTAFTVAHALTLTLTVFDLVPATSSIVEPLIALSIAIAAFWGRKLESRGLLMPMTFGFGLVHGLGFAAGLEALGNAGGSRLVSLFAFNLGIESGHLIATAILFPLLVWGSSFARGVVALRWCSIAIGCVGSAIFVWRILPTS